MKICYIADGSSIHAQRWINFFAAAGYEVHLIYWKTRPDLDKRIHIHLLSRFAPKIWAVTRYISFVQWIFQVRKILKDIRPDVVDAHFVIDNGLLAACSGFHPFIATGWGSDIMFFPWRNFLWKSIATFVLKRADRIFCNSDYMGRRMLSLGAKPDKVFRINHGADIAKFGQHRRDESIKEKLGVAGHPVVISMRHLKPLYNVEMLIKAVPLVLERAPQTRFILASDGELRGSLEQLAAALGVSDSVKFIGYVPHDDIPGYLATSEIYVSTSRSDSSSQGMQEAMASGLAPIVTELPDNHEWITDGENGFIVPQDDHKTLAEKIVTLINNPKMREEFGKKSRQKIEDIDDYIKEMGKVEKLYEDLIKNYRANPRG
ncbi:MAG: glycosyltransferase [Dehalococcoidales bacterium]